MLGIHTVILNPLICLSFDEDLSLDCVIALLRLAALGEQATIFEMKQLQYHNTA